ncbi:pyrin domain-containing protein 1-like isoform X2 [Alligator sinensis]|uniref:Pyrin domain-containing protein 1-like isoform X2 n=1 Tax=Alligator sinensis TaxID=38654 RepID=A0A1U7SCX5_ALLSI|nr:pyrin domain-containing protein 1-like isoform X2 [Alligator sinensis]
MERTIRDSLLEALEDLEEQKFKEFKFKLDDIPVKDDCRNIPRGRLEQADRLDLTNMLISFYGQDYAMEVTIAVLEAINRKDLAFRLRRAAFH